MVTRTEGDTYTPMISEIFTKVNNAKDKPAKIEVPYPVVIVVT